MQLIDCEAFEICIESLGAINKTILNEMMKNATETTQIWNEATLFFPMSWTL